MTEEELFNTLSPGQTWRSHYSDNNINNAIWHIRGIVDDYIVCRRWRKRRARWEYFTVWSYDFWYRVSDGTLIKAGYRKDKEQ